MIRAGFALLAALSLAACHARTQWPTPAPALWQVEGPRGERGWLFGTIHALPEGARWETPALERALGEAGTLVVEVANLADATAGARAFAAVSRSPGLPPLLQRVPAADRPALARALANAGLDERAFATVESWAAAVMIANAGHAGEAANGVDRALLARRVPVVGLEGFAEQFAIFDRLPQAEQDDLLRLTAEDDGAAQDRQETRAWIAGDLPALEREAHDGILADPQLRQALLVDRNARWVGRIAPLVLQGKRPFVAVGAAHMLGSAGLPAQLASRGFKVTRIE